MKEFLELADAMNYSAAASKLFISQPTLSRHIQAMEKELGFRIVESSNHGISLTRAGENAEKSFRKILKEYESFLNRNKYFSNEITGALSIGILYYLMGGCFDEFLKDQNCFLSIQRMTLRPTGMCCILRPRYWEVSSASTGKESWSSGSTGKFR